MYICSNPEWVLNKQEDSFQIFEKYSKVIIYDCCHRTTCFDTLDIVDISSFFCFYSVLQSFFIPHWKWFTQLALSSISLLSSYTLRVSKFAHNIICGEFEFCASSIRARKWTIFAQNWICALKTKISKRIRKKEDLSVDQDGNFFMH